MKGLYDFGRESILGGDVDWDAHVIKAILIDTADYAVDLATHQFLSDIPVAARVAISPALTNKTKTAGVADADDPTFLGVTGDPVEAVIHFKDTGTEGTSILISYNDEGTNLPFSPNGGDVVLEYDSGPNRIFML